MADFTSPEATATRAALQVYPFLEGMVPYPSVTPNTPISPEDFIRGKMSPYGIEPTFQGDFTKLFRGENLLNNRGVGRYWSHKEKRREERNADKAILRSNSRR